MNSRMMAHEFEWDDRKSLANLQKHGIRFEDAASAFSGAMLVRKDERFDYGEDRYLAIGLLDGREITIVFTSAAGASA